LRIAAVSAVLRSLGGRAHTTTPAYGVKPPERLVRFLTLIEGVETMARRRSRRHTAASRRQKPRTRRRLAVTGAQLWGIAGAIAASVTAGLLLHLILARHITGPPVKVDAVLEQRHSGLQGFTWIFPRPLHLSDAALSHLNALYADINQDQGGAYGSLTRYDRWAVSQGGVAPDLSIARIVLEGNSSHTVQLIGASAQTQCSAPLRGAILASPPAAEETTAAMGFDLDYPHPQAQDVRGSVFSHTNYFENKAIALKLGEQQVVDVFAFTHHHYCKYTLRFTLLGGSRKSALIVSDNGRPFSVTAQLPGPLSEPLMNYHSAYVAGVMSPDDKVRPVPSTYDPMAGLR
jgi:hypothetical protein